MSTQRIGSTTSPHLYAGARGHLEILKMTLAHGAGLRSTNHYGGTALIPAAERGHVDTVRALIEPASTWTASTISVGRHRWRPSSWVMGRNVISRSSSFW